MFWHGQDPWKPRVLDRMPSFQSNNLALRISWHGTHTRVSHTLTSTFIRWPGNDPDIVHSVGHVDFQVSFSNRKYLHEYCFLSSSQTLVAVESKPDFPLTIHLFIHLTNNLQGYKHVPRYYVLVDPLNPLCFLLPVSSWNPGLNQAWKERKNCRRILVKTHASRHADISKCILTIIRRYSYISLYWPEMLVCIVPHRRPVAKF